MEVKRRQSWDKEETRYFLNLIKERKIMKCLCYYIGKKNGVI